MENPDKSKKIEILFNQTMIHSYKPSDINNTPPE